VWHTFDARGNRPRIDLMPIARGPGAAGIAITTIFGLNMLLHFSV
jgi:hypothetical protein